MGQVNYPSNVLDTIRDLQRQVDEVRKRVGLSSATISDGTLTVQGTGSIRFVDPGGAERFFVGTRADIPLADGSPQPVFNVRDATGKLRFSVYDPDPVTNGNKPVTWIFDHLNHIILTSDINGGIAEPWLAVPLYPQFNDAAAPDVAASYRSLPISGITGTQVVWEGRIGKVSHPRIQIDGIWGASTGTPSITYALKVGGTTVGTWTTSAAAAYAVQGPWDISSKITNLNAAVQLTVSVTGGAPTDRVALGMLACWMRQT